MAQAQTDLKEGSDFVRLSKPVAVDTPAGQVEVLEFFAYSCIHCYRFEPLFAAWKAKQPAKVQARRVPVAFSEAFVPMQQLYYALESMNLLDRLHEKVFQVIVSQGFWLRWYTGQWGRNQRVGYGISAACPAHGAGPRDWGGGLCHGQR
jgi:thiol-disulfide isomerase/thioredoxin